MSAIDEGNTPTGVGKTAITAMGAEFDKKHPHGRGEDSLISLLCLHGIETPPRAWGRHLM
ncbi:hypothetical protein BMETH_296_1 [methanotrophic bacterial endosymbiont of Bathymodiolus sp.]|nr:hypothetical protein BMETH_296_1 [methanotrophic bacterial endosymbiont of Bathymodiolus sp.]